MWDGFLFWILAGIYMISVVSILHMHVTVGSCCWFAWGVKSTSRQLSSDDLHIGVVSYSMYAYGSRELLLVRLGRKTHLPIAVLLMIQPIDTWFIWFSTMTCWAYSWVAYMFTWLFHICFRWVDIDCGDIDDLFHILYVEIMFILLLILRFHLEPWLYSVSCA